MVEPRTRGRIVGVPLDDAIADRLRRDDNGLVCVVVQDDHDDRVLMVAWMDDEALRRTLTTGRVTYWSRSRQEYWRKGDTSGHLQLVRSVEIDCDGDALLLRVEQVGPACHTGTRSCFDAGGALPAVRGELGSMA
ncbi:phosphoribosyl-AMP cyclohydrolase [Pseudactinotalea suaedae]